MVRARVDGGWCPRPPRTDDRCERGRRRLAGGRAHERAGASRGQAARRARRRSRAERHDLRPDDAGEPDPGHRRRHRHPAGRATSSGRSATRCCSSPAPTAPRPSRSTSRSATTRRSPASVARPPTSSSTARSTSATSATRGNCCTALNNFWRSLSNLTINVTTPDFGCYTGEFWAVSQAAPMRRVHVNGQTTLMDYCTGPSFASGGFIADSQFDGTVINGSQQQWLVAQQRSRRLDATASGTRSSPASWARRRSASRPQPSCGGPYTTLATSPVTREAPFLYVDADGTVQRLRARRCSELQRHDRGPRPDGRPSIPLETVLRRHAGRRRAGRSTTPSRKGKNLIFTPGIYQHRQDDQGQAGRHGRPRARLRDPRAAGRHRPDDRRRRAGGRDLRADLRRRPDQLTGAARRSAPKNGHKSDPARPDRRCTTSSSGSVARPPARRP